MITVSFIEKTDHRLFGSQFLSFDLLSTFDTAGSQTLNKEFLVAIQQE